MEISEKTTLREVLQLTKMTETPYLVNPLDGRDRKDGRSPEELEVMNQFLKGRRLEELTLEEFLRVFPAWEPETVLEGLRFLQAQAEAHPVFYNIWEEMDDGNAPSPTLGGKSEPQMKSLRDGAAPDGKDRAGIFAFYDDTTKRDQFIVICPGGAYENVCSIGEGFPVAKYLHDKGYTTFVVNYRVKEYAGYPNPQDDLAGAIRFILNHAKQFSIAGDAYAVMGFSAGGHLAASFGTESLGFGHYGLPKPQAMLLAYPVITMGEYAEPLSRKNLMAEEAGNVSAQEQLSLEKQVTGKYPRTFIWQTSQDDTVPIENSRAFTESLKAAGIDYQYEVFEGTAHGWGLATGTAAEGWIDRALDFVF